MNTQSTSTNVNTVATEERIKNRQRMKVVQWVSWAVTIVFLIVLVITIVQAVNTGETLPLWSVIGLVAVIAAIVGLVVAAFVYRGVVKVSDSLAATPSDRVIGRLQTETRSIETDGAQVLHTEIEMTEGVLQLSGGTHAAIDATFTFADADWLSPLLTYNVDGVQQGELNVKQQATRRPAMRQGRNEWIIQLNDVLPTDLHLKFGASKADLKLGGMTLRHLAIVGGVGDLMIDLTGEWRQDLRADIKGGIGRTTLRLPDSVGVRVESQTGLGSIQAHKLQWNGEAHVNAAYGVSVVTLDLVVESGMGQISLE
jgi:uncharacterized integral membrane protein